MRLVRFLILVGLLAIVGRLAVRSVSVESNGDAVLITIDKQKLKQSGREAAGKVGAALQTAGRKLEGEDGQNDSRR